MSFDTWKCSICGEERPDSKISVHTKPVIFRGRPIAVQNIRHCNDNPDCVQGARSRKRLKAEGEGD